MAKADPGVLVRKSWAEKVDASVNAGDAQRAAKNVESAARPSLFYDVRPAMLRSAWTYVSGEWNATASFLKSDRSVDSSLTFKVYAPTSLGASTSQRPRGTPNSWVFLAVWRGRWEAVQEPPQSSATYAGGNGIEIGRVDSYGNNLIDNTGLLGAQLATDGAPTGTIVTGVLYLDARYFTTSGSAPDGARGIGLKAQYVQVLTPTGTQTIKVLGD